MISPDAPQDFASREERATAGLIKSPKDMLVDAEKKIAALELEKRNLWEANEKLKWQNAQLRVGLTALGKHHGHSPEEVKKIYDDYCAEQDKEYQKLAEDAKKQFMADMAAGKVPNLTVLNGDAPAMPPKVEG